MTAMILASVLGIVLGSIATIIVAAAAQNNGSGDYNFSGALAFIGGAFIILIALLVSLIFQMFWLTVFLPAVAVFAVHFILSLRP